MKRILSIITAGCLALLAFSCAKVEEKAVVDISKATAPVLQSFTAEDDIVVTYTPAVFTMGFNEKMATYHTLAMVSVDGKASNVTLSTKNDGSHLTLTRKTLVNALKVRGFEPLDVVSVELVVRGAIQNPSEGITNAFVDSEGKATVSVEMPEEVVPTGNPWADFTEASPWGLIGSIASTGNSWNADGPMYMTPDGNKHVARNVKLTPDDQFKVRKDGGWDTNFGAPGDTEPYVMTVGEAIEATAGGKNLGVPAEGNYDLLLDEEAGTLTLYAAFETYPGFDEISNWSVIGAIASFEMEWNKDIQMITDGEWHVAEGVVLTPEDQFKFRMDQKWDTNIGAAGDTEPFVVTLGEEYSGAAGGKNLAVAVDGAYDLLCNPATNSFMVVESLGGKSPLIGGDEPGPEPEPVEVKGWNIIGLNGKWGDGEDILATEKDGVWTAYITAEDKTEFKWRKDGKWESDYGMSKDEGYTYNVGTAFPAVAGGANIPVEKGFYKVVLDLSDAEAPTINVISDFEIYSLIGDFNGWGGDVDMTETESGIWVSPATALTTGGFKIRSGHDWTLSYGGALTELGVEFDAISDDGPNIIVPADAEYVVTFDKNNLKITVEEALPSNVWSLIGVNGDWGTDVFMTEMMPGIWVSPKVTIESEGWKIRFNRGWDVNRGGKLTEAGVFAKAVPGGDNIALTGSFQVVFNANNETIGTLVWGVVGSIASIDGFSWNMDVPMNLASDGKWYSLPVTLAEGDEIKIRKDADWAENFGGTFAEANTVFEAVAGGDNIKAVGTYVVVYDPVATTITLSTNFWGLIGDFNSWGGDKFMMFDGANWVAYNQSLAGGWKIRQSSGWDNNRGGVFAEKNAFLEAVPGGDNINVGELTGFDVVYVPSNEIIFIGDAAEMPEAN